MISCMASAAWSHHVSSPCYTEHGQRYGVILSARLTGASVTRDHTLDTCKPSCMPGVGRPFFIPMIHNPLGTVGYVTAPKLSSRGGEAGAMWQHQSPPR
jgi:hypothetical protein